jgi:hypothetical protein
MKETTVNRMTAPQVPAGDLRLGHVLDAAGIAPADAVVLRHTYQDDGLRSRADLTPEGIVQYVRRMSIRNKLGPEPERLWVSFIADGGRRSRLIAVHENHGENDAERTEQLRYFDLRHSPLLSELEGRLVIEWSKDPVNWVKRDEAAWAFRIVEIADPDVVEFPGFDELLVSYDELCDVIDDARYASWRTALASVQGVYLIADSRTGRLYVGKADGSERILGRWTSYAKGGHGGNVGLKELVSLDADHRRQLVFSVLRVFGPSVPSDVVNASESHYKRALLTRDREWGLNRN